MQRGSAGGPAVLGRIAPGRLAFATAVRGQRSRIALMIALTAVTAGSTLATPSLLAAAVDAALHGRLTATAWLFGSMVVAESAVIAWSALAGASFHARVTANLRHRLIRDTLARGLREPVRVPVGDALSRLSMDASGVSRAVSATIGTAVSILIAVGALVALAVIDWVLVLVFLAGAVLVVVVMRTFVGSATDVFARYRQAQAALSTRLVEALSGARTIRACDSLDREVERVLVPVAELSAAGQKSWRIQRNAGWQLQIIFPILEIGLFAVAGLRLISGVITPGELLAVVGYVHLGLGVVDQLDELFALGEARASARRAGELLGAPDRVPNRATAYPQDGSVEFAGVRVAGTSGPLLDGVDLVVPAGTSLAVVGVSGSGKSTLALVAGGLVMPDQGTVRIGGVPLTDLAPDALRRVVAYAFERPELLGETVDDVIGLGVPHGGALNRVLAASAAQAHQFIMRLPYGYHTPLNRAPMSGGEAQRLGLARAFAQGALVLILDDATASLDTATEAKVAAAMDALRHYRTCLIVTHRPATAARADRVAWIDRGRLRAVAPHHELWINPSYRAIFDCTTDDPTTSSPTTDQGGHR